MSKPETFDCFLSYNSRDKPVVRALAETLRDHRITVWFDEERLRPGYPWQSLLEEAVRSSGSVAVLVGGSGLGPWEEEEMRAALSFAVREKRPVIPVLLPDAPAKPDLPVFLQGRTWVDMRPETAPSELLAVDQLIWGITGNHPGRAASGPSPEVVSRDQSVFHGRNDDRDQTRHQRIIISTVNPTDVPAPQEQLRRPFRIFVASPGDVSEERHIVRQVVERVRMERGIGDHLSVEPIAWDQPEAAVVMQAALTPQNAICRGLPKPRDCDLVVTIIWGRMGTPLSPEYCKPDGSCYASGTEWEYLDALDGFRERGCPVVWLFRRLPAPRLGLDVPDLQEQIAQWQAVERFFAQLTNADGSIVGGMNSYEDPDAFGVQFEQLLRDHLTRVAQDLVTAHLGGGAQGSTADDGNRTYTKKPGRQASGRKRSAACRHDQGLQSDGGFDKEIHIRDRAREDLAAFGVETTGLVTYLSNELKRHPLLFGAPFASLPFVFEDKVLLLTWDMTTFAVERLVERAQAYAPLERWQELLSAYRLATELKYRSQAAPVLLTRNEARRTEARYRDLIARTEAFLRTQDREGSTGAHIDNVICGLNLLLDEAHDTYLAGQSAVTVSRYEMILSTVHKLVLEGLPRGEGAEVAGAAAQLLRGCADDSGTERPRILVVDNDETTRRLYRRLLEGRQFEEYGDPVVAIPRLVSGGLDLILSDLVLPSIDGVEFLRLAHKTNPGARLVLVSLHNALLDRLDDIRRELPFPEVTTLEKPVWFDEMNALLAGEQVPHRDKSVIGDARNLPLFDRASALAVAGGDHDLARDLFDALMAGFRSELALLRESLARGDLASLAPLAHRAGGATRYTGTQRLHQRVMDLERASRAGDAVLAKQLILELAEIFGEMEEQRTALSI